MIDLNIIHLQKIYYDERLQAAAQARLAASVRAPGLQDRLLSNIGNYLISVGQGLKDRYQPEASDSSLRWANRLKA